MLSTHTTGKSRPIMKSLDDILHSDFLPEGDLELLDKVRPILIRLINRLKEQGPQASEDERLKAFAEAFHHINQFEDEIETVERETILEAMYDIGDAVGLD
ncbi:DUF5713 family protein, partial [Pseudoduganella flava]